MRRLLVPVLFWAVLCSPPSRAEGPWAPPEVPSLEALLQEQTPLPPLPASEGRILTLADCLTQAKQSHPALGASWAQVLQAQARYQQVWALYYPTLSLTLGEVTQTAFAGPLSSQEVVGALGLPEGANLALTVTQTIFDFGQREAQVDAARGALRASYLSFESDWVDQAQAVQSTYLAAVEQTYLLAVRNSDLARATLSRDVAKKFLSGGVASLIDVTQAEIQLAQAEAAVAQVNAEVRNAHIALAQAMGARLEDIQSRPLEDLLSQEVVLPTYDQAVGELDTHPKLLSISAQEDSSSASALAEKRTLSPNLGLSTSLQGYQGTGVNAGMWQVQLLLTIPLYDPTVGPKVSEFEAQILEAQQRWADIRLGLLEQLQKAYSDSVGAKERSSLALRQAKTAVLNFQLASKRYQAGLSEYTELLNALGFVSQAQGSYVAALADQRSAEVDLIQATGASAQGTKEYFRTRAGQQLLEDMRETDLLKGSPKKEAEKRPD